MIEWIDARLRVARMAGRTNSSLAASVQGLDLERALEVAKLARQAVDSGTAGYALLSARRDQDSVTGRTRAS